MRWTSAGRGVSFGRTCRFFGGAAASCACAAAAEPSRTMMVRSARISMPAIYRRRAADCQRAGTNARFSVMSGACRETFEEAGLVPARAVGAVGDAERDILHDLDVLGRGRPIDR